MPDTLQSFERARRERFWDGGALWVAQRLHGSVYMLGYHAEMTLKCAYFRLLGVALTSQLDIRTGALHAKKALGVKTPDENFHSVRFWRHAILALRNDKNSPLNAALEADLIAYVDAVYGRWRVEMRYQVAQTAAPDVEAVAGAVDWLDLHYRDLYEVRSPCP
jgi:hypothetical protein